MQVVPDQKKGYYHYVYGVDTSSSACVAAYITDCINQHNQQTAQMSQFSADVPQEAKDNSKQEEKSSGGLKSFLKKKKDERKEKEMEHYIQRVTKGTFCIYDIVSKKDIRVEIAIPGGTQVFAMDSTTNFHHEIKGIHEWNNVYVSSVLRALESSELPCPLMRIVRELETPSNFQEFLQIAQNIFQRECKLVYDNSQQKKYMQEGSQ